MRKLAETIKRVGLFANPEKVSSRSVVQKAAALIRKNGRVALCTEETATLCKLDLATCATVATLGQQVDLLLIFGGDGTVLRAARDLAGTPTPILGIKVGGLGFLTAGGARELPETLEQIWLC